MDDEGNIYVVTERDENIIRCHKSCYWESLMRETEMGKEILNFLEEK